MEKDTHKEQKMLTRRRFLGMAGAALGAGAAACGGLFYFGLRTPSSVDFPQSTCPGSESKRILVAYASKCGATAGVAQTIAERLCAQGLSVDLLRARDVKELGSYSAVILGSAVYMGRLLDEAVNFARSYLAGQSDLPLALFDVCLAAKDPSPEKVQESLGYLDPLHEYFTPVAVAAFAGRIDLDSLPFLYRIFAQADESGSLSPGDYRDWDVIARWCDSLPGSFRAV